MKRKILSLILVLALLLPVAAPAAHAVAPVHGNMCTLCNDCDRIVSFKSPVHRIYGATRYDTAYAIADTLKTHLGVEKFANIIVASGKGFADALAGSYLAAATGAPILLSSGGNTKQLCSYIRENLAQGGTVYLLGGTAAVPDSMEKSLSGYHVKRLGGATRYDTNLAILNEAGVGAEDILICTGTGFADSLSASALGMPILLVGDALTPAQKEFLETRSVNNKIIIGGTTAVSESMEKQIRDISWHTAEILRIGGVNRYATSVLVAKHFYTDPTVLTVAYAQNFPDGLCGGALAYFIGTPMILSATGRESDASAYARKNHACWGYVLGGPGLISDEAVRKIFVARNDNVGGDYENYDYYLSEDSLWQPYMPDSGSFAIMETELELLINDRFQLDYSYPGDVSKLVWATSDPDVVLVGPGGLLYAVAEGTAVIRVTDGQESRYSCISVITSHTPEQKKVLARRVAQEIADDVMNDPTLKTDMERIAKAAWWVNRFVAAGHYSTFHPDYNSAYGTFVAGYSSCAGCTRAMGLVLECMGFKWKHVNENQWDHQWCIVYNMDGRTGFADGSVLGFAGYGDRDKDTWYRYSGNGVEPMD